MIIRSNNKSEIEESKNNSSINEKELAKVSFYTVSDEFLFEKQYPINYHIGGIIEEFQNRINKEENIIYSFYIKNKSSEELVLIDEQNEINHYISNLQDTLGLMGPEIQNNNSIINKTGTYNKCLTIYVKTMNKLIIPDNIEQYIIDNTNYVGKPAINQLKYYTYDKINKKLYIISLSQKDIDKIKIQL